MTPVRAGNVADSKQGHVEAPGFLSPRERVAATSTRKPVAAAHADGIYLLKERGAGKTTELRRLKRDLEDDGYVVFYADMTEYLPLNSPIEIGDFPAGRAQCARQLRRRRSSLWQRRHQESGVEKFVSFLQTKVDLDGIDWTVDTLVGKLGFRFKVKQNTQFKKALQERSRSIIDGLVQASRDFVDGLVAYIRKRTSSDDQAVVFIVDSVERLSGIGEEAQRVFDSVENLFGSHRDKLRFAMLSVIYSVPPYISAVAQAGTGNLVCSLPLPHVFEKPAPGANGVEHKEGVDRVVDVIARRYPGWRQFLSEAQLRRLVRSAGGDLRELFLLLREALNLVDADDDDSFPVDDDVIAQAEKLRRNQFGVIPESDLKWLARVVATHEHGLPSQAELGTLARLLDGKLVFQYRNGDNWYDVHPLLWPMVQAYAGTLAGS